LLVLAVVKKENHHVRIVMNHIMPGTSFYTCDRVVMIFQTRQVAKAISFMRRSFLLH